MACELIQREFSVPDSEEKVLVGVRQLSASAALALHLELVGKVGGAIFPFIQNNYKFGDIIHLMRQAEAGVMTELMKRVVCYATLNGKEVKTATYDMHYNGKMMLACQVFAFVCEANYLDFFKQGLEINAQRQLEEAEASKLAEQKNSGPVEKT